MSGVKISTSKKWSHITVEKEHFSIIASASVLFGHIRGSGGWQAVDFGNSAVDRAGCSKHASYSLSFDVVVGGGGGVRDSAGGGGVTTENILPL